MLILGNRMIFNQQYLNKYRLLIDQHNAIMLHVYMICTINILNIMIDIDHKMYDKYVKHI